VALLVSVKEGLANHNHFTGIDFLDEIPESLDEGVQ